VLVMTDHWRDFLDPRASVGRYLDWDAVEKSAGLSRTTAWRLRRIGAFPDPYSLSPGRVAYRELEIEAWKSWRAQHRSRASTSGSGPQSPPSAPEGPRTAPRQPPAPLSPADRLPLLGTWVAPSPLARSCAKTARRSRVAGPDQISFDF
jgi:prophage regulatory protein